MTHRFAVLAAALTASLSLSAADAPHGVAAAPAPVQRAMTAFSANALRAHDRFLSSDLLEGRGPGTRGDELAIEYIAAQFESYGLKPAGDDGTFIQRVPMVGIAIDPERSSLRFTAPGKPEIGPLRYLDEYVATDESQTEASDLDSELVFVGHGVVAPEYRWDDYKGLDVRGKTLVMLVDDPPANAQEPNLFEGKRRTYYGRWTYKYEIGAAKGARGVILIHTNEAAGYPWSVVRNSWGAERSYLPRDASTPSLHMAAWITSDIAERLMKAAGQDLGALTRAAASRDFRPVSLGYRASGHIASAVRRFSTANVTAKLEGSDPQLKDEAIIYTSHHDHLGIGKPDAKGDRIYNGAIDNATGCAILLEMARVWAVTEPRPKRSVFFSAVAAEEQGLIGSEFLGKHPPIPAGKIALDLNYDAVPELGRVRDVTFNGAERTTYYPTASKIAQELGLTVVPDLEPEQGHYYRSDHFSMGRVGIPAFSIEPGQDVEGHPAGWGREQSTDYRTKRYHQPSDEFNPDWNWAEGVQMSQLGFWLGWDAANSATVPNWNPGDEYRKIRDASLKP